MPADSAPDPRAVLRAGDVHAALADLVASTRTMGMGVLDRELRYVRIDATLAAMNGLPADAHLGRTVREIVPAAAADFIEGQLRGVLERGEPVVDLPFAFTGPDGTTRRFRSSYHPVRDDAGEVTGIVGLAVELTGDDDAGRVAAERLRRVAESGVVGLFFWTIDGGITEANDAFLDLLGYTRDDLAAGRLDWRAMTPVDWAEGDRRMVEQLLATGTHPPYPKEYVAKDGTRVAVLVTSAMLEGRGDRGVCVCLDDRARRAAEGRAAQLQALSAALAAARTVEEVADVVVARAVADTGARTGMLSLRTPDADEAVIVRESGFGDALHARYARIPLTVLSPGTRALRTGVPVWVTGHGHDTLAGSYPETADIWTELGVAAIASVPLTVAGGVIGAMSFTWTAPRDFDDGERAFFVALGRQAALAVERARLFDAEHAARAEAERARVEAVAANRAKSQFLATMSHELRTPLNAIGGYAELMEMGLRGPVTVQQREDLSRIQRSQHHLLGLINEVLDYARLESGSVRYELADVGVAGVLATVESLVLPQARARGIALDIAAGDPTRAVRADAEKLRRILINLLSNAVKFTDGGGRVTVRCAPVPGQPRVALTVADTGVGIAADQLEAVFEPFVQVGRALNRPAEGTGLGLAISRDLARGMGGELTAESVVGVGSTFTLVLPTGG